MKTGGIGGGHTISGLYFECRADLVEAIKKLKGYKVGEDGKIFFKDKLVAQSLKKNKLYKYLDANGVDYKALLSARLLPDSAILVFSTKTLYVIEMKFQKITGLI